MRQKTFILAAFIIAAVPATAQIQYTVNGTFADNGKMVYLIDELTEQKIDSTVVADGKFSFKCIIPADTLRAIHRRDSNQTVPSIKSSERLITDYWSLI